MHVLPPLLLLSGILLARGELDISTSPQKIPSSTALSPSSASITHSSLPSRSSSALSKSSSVTAPPSADTSSISPITESPIVAKSKLKPGAIAGIFLGILTFIILIITVIWLVLRQRRLNKAQTESRQLELEGSTPNYELQGTPAHKWASATEVPNDKPGLARNGNPRLDPNPHGQSFAQPVPRSDLPGDGAEPFPSYESPTELYSHRTPHTDYSSSGAASPGTMPADLPIETSPWPHPNVLHQRRSDFTVHPQQEYTEGIEYSTAPTAEPFHFDTEEEARLYMEERRLSAEIAEAERLRELKMQKSAVSSKLALVRSRSPQGPSRT